MNGSMWWWAWLLPAVRPLTTFVLMLVLGFVQRRTVGRWPTVAEWRVAAGEPPSLWSLAARLADAARRQTGGNTRPR
jgi:hypothetical protein